MEQLEQFYNSLPPELQEKIAMLEPEEQQQVLMELIQRQQANQSEYAQMGANPQGDKVPVEAERNETLTVQDGEEPEVEGGYLKEISRNPISGQATYEIPDNHHNATHDQGGVSMHLKEGDVVNSDKTVIPTDFRVDGSNFKGKTFKQASDYISKKENELQKNFNDLTKKGKTDRVSEGSLSLMLAKLASSRNQLNELQEIVLSHKEKKEENEMRMGGKVYAQSGTKVGERIPYILDFQMPNLKYDNLSGGKPSPKIPDNVKDRMVNVYKAEYPVINAADGVNINQIHQQITPQTTLGQFMEMTKGLAAQTGAMSFSASGKPIKVNMPKEDILRTIVTESNKNGLDPAFMLAMGDIESGFKPNAKAGKSSATGLFQFIDSTAKQYGLLGESFDNRKDPIANTKAAIELTKDNQAGLEKYGVPVTPTTLYLAHQQGLGGAVEIYNAAMKGTPVSVAVAKNMQNNFKTTDPASYLSKTAQAVMSRVNAYLPKLQSIDENADYEAFNYKQKYSSGAPVQQIKQNISEYGMKGLVKRTKEGAPLASYNEEQNQAQPQMAYGGYINHGYNISIPGPELMGRRKDYLMDGNYSKGGSIMPHGFNISVPGPELMGKRRDYLMDANYATGGYVAPHGYNISVPGPELMGRRRDYLMDGNYAYGGYAQDGITAEQDITNQLSSLNSDDLQSLLNRFNSTKNTGMLPGVRPLTIPATPKLGFQTGTAIPYSSFTSGTNAPILGGAAYDPTTSEGYDPNKKFTYVQGKSKNQYPLADYNLWKEFLGTIDPESSQVKDAIKEANKYSKKKGDWRHYASDTAFGRVHAALYPAYQKWVEEHQGPPSPNFRIDAENNRSEVTLPTGEKAYLPFPTAGDEGQSRNIDLTDISDERPKSPGEGDLKKPKGKKGTDWLSRINYGLREAIPYLDNLRLLREGRIMPTLQQKPYQNPYENLSVDYSIQSALNDLDRANLTAMADERGNPSVRNARLAQMKANADSNRNQLYTQKYNQEQQLKNAKTLGEYDYLNRWTDTNMALKKRYEQEVLQTIENQRQQQHMALDKMANDYLRRQEQNQAMQLALMNTNYDWDKYREELVNNPEKAEATANWIKQMIQLQSQVGGTSDKKKKSSKDDEDDTQEIIIGGKKFNINPVTTKYGGNIKGKKKLSLKNYY